MIRRPPRSPRTATSFPHATRFRSDREDEDPLGARASPSRSGRGRSADMTHDEVQDLLGAYALDAVDDDERALVEDHLAECPRCRAEVHDHREVAALLAHGGQDAPEGIWDRIVGSLEEAPPALRLAPMEIGRAHV